ncbi:ComF family protein [Desulfovibrio sp. OttesenSCG-928-A18]|nr:ComF family protein [Desulfovibrio sp. OttesenSCG-928-A18]
MHREREQQAPAQAKKSFFPRPWPLLRLCASTARWLGQLFVGRIRGERRCVLCHAVFFSFPRDGAEAGGRGAAGSPFCPGCLSSMPRREKGHCPLCGEPAAWPELPLAPCIRCVKAAPPWDSLHFHGLYGGQLRRVLRLLKFVNMPQFGQALGWLLSRQPELRLLQVDLVSAIPLHEKRLARRGYNQSLEIARALARSLSLPLRPDVLRRSRYTPPQVGFNFEARQQNMRQAFTATAAVRGQRILLVDDILTTGATMRAAVGALHEAGALAVHAAVVSRVARHGRGVPV